MTVQSAIMLSPFIPLDFKVSDALFVNSTSLLSLNSFSWLTPHLTISFASFSFLLLVCCFKIISSHVSIALSALKSLYISHLISPTRLLLSVK
jgi:hypothetical protein